MKNPPASYPRPELRKVAELKAHPDSVRAASQESLHWLAQSQVLFGQLALPVLNARTGVLLDGDRRLADMRARGVEETWVWLVDLDPALEDAAHLALNNHAGEWQWQPVSLLLKELASRGQPLGLTGFHESDTGPLCAADWKVPAVGPMDGSDAAQIGLL